MEATRLIDPAFWASGEPLAVGGGLDPRVLAQAEGLVFFRTSGSLGEPQWIGHSRAALLLSAAVVNRHLEVDEDSRWGLALPWYHVGGFGVAARAFEAGATLRCLSGKWAAPAFAEWVAAEGVTHTSLVPTQVHDLVSAAQPAPAALRAVVVGGGALDPATGEAARRLGWPLLASYGMTEAGSQIATQGLELLDQPYQNDELPLLPHWEAREGEGGRIEIRGEALFQGRLKRCDDDWHFVAREESWYPTSDRGRVDGRQLSVLGRVDTTVKILGELVDPLEVEREFAVSGLCVLALPDPRRGAVLCGVAEDGETLERARRRLEAYNAEVEGFRRIGSLRLVEAFPRSPLGKIRRAQLQGRLEDGTIS